MPHPRIEGQSKAYFRGMAAFLNACIILWPAYPETMKMEIPISELQRACNHFTGMRTQSLAETGCAMGCFSWLGRQKFIDSMSHMPPARIGLATDKLSSPPERRAFISLSNSVGAEPGRAQFGADESAQEKPHSVEDRGGPKSFARALAEMADTVDSTTSEEILVSALKIMDGAILKRLNQDQPISLEVINKELRGWITGFHGPKESYEIVSMGPNSSWYALIAKVEVWSAIRFYVKSDNSTSYSLVAQLDPSDIPDPNDYHIASLIFLQINEADGVFVTFFSDGAILSNYCAAWRFDGMRVQELWNSGHDFVVLEKAIPGGIVLKRCSDIPNNNCKNPTQVRYTWSGKKWGKLP
ncbi:MAG: hypothetical protein WBC25_09355 [Candidatus Acidiferrum sp.]